MHLRTTYCNALNQHTEQELKALSNKVKDHRMRMRLLAVAHFKAGKNRAKVARILNVSRAMVNDWVANYLKGGRLNGEMLQSFENAVKDYRVFHAEEALRAFNFWQNGAAYRYTHPDPLANPRSFVAMAFWASIGLPGPPEGPPDFSALTYEYLADELVMGASIDLATFEQLMSPDDFATLLPSDPAAEVATRFKAKVLDTVTGGSAGAVEDALKKTIR
jgi:hypothetical protein